MRNMRFLILSILLLSSCNSIENRDKKLHEVISSQMSRGLDKNKTQLVDEVKLMDVDSLTEKALFFIKLEETDALIVKYKRYIEDAKHSYIFHTDNFKFNNKYGLSNKLDEKGAERDSGRIVEYSNKLQHALSVKDSLFALSKNSDGEKFEWFRVNCDVMYSTYNKKDTIPFILIIDKDYNPEDTSITVLNYINEIDERNKALKKLISDLEKD